MRTTDKPFNIDKMQVYEAYKAVKSKAGGAGVDGQTIGQFEADLKSNLYKIWNRMSSGSYFPPPVRAVTIPKKSGVRGHGSCSRASGSIGRMPPGIASDENEDRLLQRREAKRYLSECQI